MNAHLARWNFHVTPGDILLLHSRDKASATAIKFGQSIKRMRPAHYTHVAVVLNDTLIVDAMPNVGVTLREWRGIEVNYDIALCKVARHNGFARDSYCASESIVMLHRSVAVKLAESVGGVRNPGDVLERLAGKWLDCIKHDWFRTTPLLTGAAGQAWSPEQRAIAHIRLHDSIRSKGTLSPAEAAALLFHAFVGQEPTPCAGGYGTSNS
ncbi:hypothetical protein PQQ86_00075 [Paraburkholderia sediminicola]|uniref:hypothetical protein n=1 Tax=Paraburkholderia TaxID=1822464 RepID=UPI0038BD8502